METFVIGIWDDDEYDNLTFLFQFQKRNRL